MTTYMRARNAKALHGAFRGPRHRRSRSGLGLLPWVLAIVVGGSLPDSGLANANAQCIFQPTWEQVGPAPLAIGSAESGDGRGPDSGMVRDIAIDPSGTTDLIIYVATDNGGVWKSTDGGTNWFPKTDFMPSLNMGSIALDPGNPAIVYAGTGTRDSGDFVRNGVGVYKSTDGGDHWVIVGGDVLAGRAINRIVLPEPNVLLLGCDTGVYRSIDGGASFGANAPLFNDHKPIRGGEVTDLDLDTVTPSTVYASISGFGIYKSSDSGASFPDADRILGDLPGTTTRPAYLVLAQSTLPDNRTMYVNAQLPGTTAAMMLYSTNAGGTWNSIAVDTSPSADLEIPQSNGYDQTVGVDPKDALRVYFGARALFMVTDGGAMKITAANRIDLNVVHTDQHALLFSPPSHRPRNSVRTRLYNGTDGGLATTDDATGDGGSWTILNGQAGCDGPRHALATVLFRQIDIGRGSTANNAYTYGAAQDLGLSVHPGYCTGTTWLLSRGGDGDSVSVHPLDPRIALAKEEGLRITTTSGTSWALGGTGLPDWPRVVYFDPNAIRAYATVTNELYESPNNGTNFTRIASFPAYIIAISKPQIDPNVMWVGLTNGNFARTTNALAGNQSTWERHTPDNSPFGSSIQGIAAHPFAPREAVVIYRDTWFPSRVVRTVDGGAHWDNITGDLPLVKLSCVAIDPNSSPPAILVGTDSGVLRTLNLGVTWRPVGIGLPNVPCTSLALDWAAAPSLLRVGTYGRSVFELAYDRQYIDLNATRPPDGTRERPFSTLDQAVGAPATGAMRYYNFRAGSYTVGTTPISHCGTLNAVGGTVILGQ